MSRTCSPLRLIPAVVVALGVTIAIPPPATAQLIDTLEYFLTDDESVELIAGNGERLSQTTQGNAVVRVKWRSPQHHEYYTYDDTWIYLRYDSSWSGPSGATSYEFTEVPGKGGRWMKRQMWVGDSFTVSKTAGQTFYFDDCTVQSRPNLLYTNTLEAYYPSYFIGGQLGTDEVIVLKYDWNQGANYEKFFFSKQWGWIRWEHWVNGQLDTAVSWDAVTGASPVAPQAKCVAFPAPCQSSEPSCPFTFECTGRQCFTHPPAPGECQAGYDWCHGGCCCRCT